MPRSKFDLALSYPQWQGSGRSTNLRRGAEAAAGVCGQFAPLTHVPLAGDGEAAGGINRWTAIFDQFRSAQTILSEMQPRRILTAGGDCAVDVAVIDYLHRQYRGLTVIWVDAHLDANTPDTTPSGNFHGMPVAAILGSAPTALRGLLGTPLPPSQFLYASADVGDDGEWKFQQSNGLRWAEPGQRISGPLHVHFDLDVLDAALAVVRQAASGGNLVGLTITEFAPADQAEAAEGSRFLKRLCEASCTA